jgi:UDP-N-acetylmuramoylalanine--D-glutamate ligase
MIGAYDLMTPTRDPAFPLPSTDAPRRIEDWTGRRTLVVGLARSGLAAAKALAARGIAVTATDTRSEDELAAKGAGERLIELEDQGVRLVTGKTGTTPLAGIDIVVTSPGVPPTAPLLAAADERGVPVVAEIELAFQLSRAPWVALTGTNGKSTTTALTAAIFRAAGYDARLCGNIGVAATEEAVTTPEGGVLVAEVSSFQLERVIMFRPRVAVLTGLTPDHLDRHGSLEVYAGLKARLFARQEATDLAVLNADDAATAGWAGRYGLSARVAYFRAGRNGRAVPEGSPLAAAVLAADGAWVDEEGRIVRVREGHTDVLLPANALRIPGPHNLANALAATATTLAFQTDAARVAEALAAFGGLPHRIEAVGTASGVAFYNDSKATNLDSMRTALLAFAPPVVVIAGGRDKAQDWSSLATLARERIGHLVLIGEAAPTIGTAFRGVPQTLAQTLIPAVRVARERALALGGVPVLLSPGCASFDQFKDYEDRGEQFRQAVARLREEVGA